MATRETTKPESGGILSMLSLDKEAREKIDGLDKKRQTIVEETDVTLNKYEQTIEDIRTGKIKGEEARTNLSELEKSIERGKQFQGEITDLAESLTSQFTELGQFFGDASNYKGLIEKGLATLGLTKMADKQRISRVRHADLKQNLQNVLDYGGHMVVRLNNFVIDNATSYRRIEESQNETTKTLTDNQPLYEQWRTSREGFERDLKALDEKIDKAEQSEYAVLQTERNTLKAKLDEAQAREDHHFGIVQTSTKALGMQREHLESYKQMMSATMQFKTRMQHDIKNVTQIYLAVPVAIQTTLGIKAASGYDKAMKYANEKATATVVAAARGVMNEVANRAERPLIEPDKLEAYRKALDDGEREFTERMEALKTTHARVRKSS